MHFPTNPQQYLIISATEVSPDSCRNRIFTTAETNQQVGAGIHYNDCSKIRYVQDSCAARVPTSDLSHSIRRRRQNALTYNILYFHRRYTYIISIHYKLCSHAREGTRDFGSIETICQSIMYYNIHLIASTFFSSAAVASRFPEQVV